MATRAWLTGEQQRLADDRAWVAERRRTLDDIELAMKSLGNEAP
jgi:hypothetical protein